jgi:low affinity Fe/Cu permease
VVAAAMKRRTMPLNNSEKPQERDFFCRVRDGFRHFAHRSAEVLGSAWAFIGAIFIIVVWGLTGPAFHFSDTWQLIINTGTTIVTFLMVFLIQNTQNRDAKAMHLKLDELIRAIQGARNRLVDLEKLSDEELKRLEEQFTRVRNKAAQGESEMDPTEETETIVALPSSRAQARDLAQSRGSHKVFAQPSLTREVPHPKAFGVLDDKASA